MCNHDSMASGAAELLAHWGYFAIFVAVILGNIGFPVPEETILALGGYMSESDRPAGGVFTPGGRLVSIGVADHGVSMSPTHHWMASGSRPR